MATGSSKKNRRRDVRRAIRSDDRPWLAWFRQRDVAWCLLFITAFAIVGSAIALSVRGRPGHYLGQLMNQPVIARLGFEAIDLKATERERIFNRREVPPVFRHNAKRYNELEQELLELLQLHETKFGELSPDYVESIALTPVAHTVLGHYALGVGEDNPQTPEHWASRVHDALRRIFTQVVLVDDDYRRTLDGPGHLKAIHPDPYKRSDAEQLVSERLLLSVNDRPQIARLLAGDLTNDFPPALQPVVLAVVLKQLAPTYLFDEATTQTRRDNAYAATGEVKINYRPDQVLVSSSTQLSIDDLRLIAAERAAWERSRTRVQKLMPWLGLVGLMGLIATGVWGYIFHYNARVRRNPMRGLALTLLLLTCQFTAVLLAGVWPEIALGGVTFAALTGAVILAVVYDRRFALAMGIALTFLIVLSLQMPVSAALVVLTGVATAAAQLDDVRSRSKLVWVGFWSGMAMGGAAFIAGLAERNFGLSASETTTSILPWVDTTLSAPWRLLGADVLYVVTAGCLVGLLVQGILPVVIEPVFRVTTAMTLRELNDASHPLLQRLAQEAPGTYQHSLRIADMAEAAADAIGADGLLCRVGAMYHDIGKINKPIYFIENQAGGVNKHDKLSPAMSLLIIIGHVKDGIELAREFNLPQVIRHLIESHHGTTLVEFFYHAARKQTEAQDKPAPSEFEFRYPGPKPQTREAAIMLLCDGIEGAARAMDEPTAVRLEQLTHNMAIKRLMDGQFDDCNLTLTELSKVEATISKTLCAVYHKRIKYPEKDKPKVAVG
ncbi:MAG: HDIG domain-containing metalloprotein [Algisphaera sp.]